MQYADGEGQCSFFCSYDAIYDQLDLDSEHKKTWEALEDQ
jgi:hypothetical protein